MGKKYRVIVGVEVMLLCMIIGAIGTSAASITPPSNQVSYNKNGQTTIQSAINDLYTKLAYGDAKASEILSGKKALIGGKQVVGTFTCPSLASQTPGDATPENIYEEKIAWVIGEKIVGAKDVVLYEQAELGDYVSYTPPHGVYRIRKEDTGYKYDQAIIPSELNLWRVIRKNNDGTLELISSYLSSDIVMFGYTDHTGKYSGDKQTPYKNYIGTLNKIAKQYETEGITVGSRHVGYDGTAVEYLTEVTMEDGYKVIGNEDFGYKKDLQLVKDALGTYEAIPVLHKVGDYTTQDYWLASRSAGYSVHYFRTRGVGLTPFIDEPVNVKNIAMDSNIQSNYIRPIVVLKSDLKITGGNGTENSPYNIGI